MKKLLPLIGLVVGVSACVALWLKSGGSAGAHCDTLDGPVVNDAKEALQKGDVTTVLKWVKKADEEEIRGAFRKALLVRDKGAEARDLADRFFFETLVCVHRAGEGAPYTGLKAAGSDLPPAVREADEALVSGSADRLVALLKEKVEHGIRGRFARAAERKKHASDSVEAGREYVESYVEFIHYAERLGEDAEGSQVPHGEGGGISPEHHHG